ESLRVQLRGEDAHPGHASGGPGKTRDVTFTHEVVAPRDDRRRRGRLPGRRNRTVADRDDGRQFELRQLGGKSRQACGVTTDIAPLEGDGVALDVPEIAERLPHFLVERIGGDVRKENAD